MIEPTEDDIGRRVVYKEYPEAPESEWDYGEIVRFNNRVVYVRYGNYTAGTLRENLEYAPCE